MARPRIVYIAGPYSDSGGFMEIDGNISRARAMAAWLVNHGIGYICPHMNSAHFEVITPGVDVAFWYEMDLQIMRGADAMFVLEGSGLSRGVAMERNEWTAGGKPVFESWELDELLEWAKPLPGLTR